MFNQKKTKTELWLRNSWGKSQEYLKVPLNRLNEIDRSFHIDIKNLVKYKTDGSVELLCKDGNWNVDPKNAMVLNDGEFRVYWHAGKVESRVFKTKEQATKFYEDLGWGYAKVGFEKGQVVEKSKFGGQVWVGKLIEQAKKDMGLGYDF